MSENEKETVSLDAEASEQISKFKDQLLIVLIKRLGGKVDIPIKEADDTGRDVLLMTSDPVNGFHFEIEKKSRLAKVAIVIDNWKLPIIKKELENAGFKFKKKPGITKDNVTLIVKTDDIRSLQETMKAAEIKVNNSKMN